MTKAIGRKKADKRKINPLYRPKPRAMKMNVNFDGQYLNGTHNYFNVTTLLNQATHLLFVDGGTTSSVSGSITKESVPVNLDGIVAKYNDYVYESVSLEWMPFVAPGVADGGSQIMISYIDNPEQIVTVNNFATPASAVSMNALVRNMKTYNAWERFTYNVPLTRRNKEFNVNSTGTVVTDVNAVNRSVQGLVVITFQSPSASALLGNFRSRYRIKLLGLNYGQST